MEIANKFFEKQKSIDKKYPVIPSTDFTARNIANKKLIDEFKTELLVHYGIQNNPKAEDAFLMAWEQGHSSGFNEVESIFMDLAKLIKPVE